MSKPDYDDLEDAVARRIKTMPEPDLRRALVNWLRRAARGEAICDLAEFLNVTREQDQP